MVVIKHGNYGFERFKDFKDYLNENIKQILNLKNV